jgi:2-methylcitrate dehydratase PrpD
VREAPAIERHGLAPKIHPCCGSAHRILDGVIELRRRHRFPTADVERVDALVGHGNARNLCYPNPRDEMQARFSLQYCVAVALLEGRLTLGDFTPDAVHRPQVRALLGRVHMAATPAGAEDREPSGRLPHQVRISLVDGRVLETSLLWPRGTPTHPLTDAEREAKLTDCCEGFLLPADLDRARDVLARIERVASVRELTDRLRFAAGSDRGERFAARHASAAE